ncbi:MAG: hypothetical protein JXA20_03920 [Spirochaetes bacterium]|nr:hypothetical protein [Spirochaetota bacterium]
MHRRCSLILVSIIIVAVAGCGLSEPVLSPEAKDWLKTYRRIGIEKVDADKDQKRWGKKDNSRFEEKYSKLMEERGAILKGMSDAQKKLFSDEMQKIDDDILIRISIYRRVQSY